MTKQKTPPGPTGGISRREFARRAVLAAATAAVLPGSLAATQDVPSPQTPQEQTPLSPQAQAEVELKIQAILRKYGDRLNDAQKADIRRLVTEGQKPLEAMRAYKLDNSDQPATVLKLYPELADAPRRVPAASAPAGKKK